MALSDGGGGGPGGRGGGGANGGGGGGGIPATSFISDVDIDEVDAAAAARLSAADSRCRVSL